MPDQLEFPELKITDEKSAMRYLADELDAALVTIAKLASENVGFIKQDKIIKVIKDGRRIMHTMRQVNEYLKKEKNYSIRKKEGWKVEQEAEKFASEIKNMMDVVKSSVVQDIVNPKISQN